MTATSQAFAGRIAYSEQLMRRLGERLSTCIVNAKHKLKLEPKPQRENTPTFYCGLQYAKPDITTRWEQPDDYGTIWTLGKAVRKGAASASVWVGVRLRFDYEALEAYLTSISVLVLAFRDAFYPLVRAEWDHRGVQDGQHAQPHWHVLTRLQAETERRILAADAVTAFDPAVQDASVRQSEILHLAMTTDWAAPNGEKYVCELPDEKSLSNWLVQTVDYAVDQVRYALVKTSTQSPAAEDFIPFGG